MHVVVQPCPMAVAVTAPCVWQWPMAVAICVAVAHGCGHVCGHPNLKCGWDHVCDRGTRLWHGQHRVRGRGLGCAHGCPMRVAMALAMGMAAPCGWP